MNIPSIAGKSKPQMVLNCDVLEKELMWFKYFIEYRVRRHIGESGAETCFPEPPELEERTSFYVHFIKHFNLNFSERVLVLLALAPHLKPNILDAFFTKNSDGRIFTEFGGKISPANKFLPTAETYIFLIAGNELYQRLKAIDIFKPSSRVRFDNIISFIPESEDSFLDTEVKITQEQLSFILSGEGYKPNFNSSFPATLLKTGMSWDDLIIAPEVLEEINEITVWIRHGDNLLLNYGLGKTIKRGYRTLFYGPPGTGKTLTASLIGKTNKLDVYRIDLSMVVSKYIGETEKNLANIFDLAENKNWILFFDEADALFGKRTQTKDAKDRYANQEVSYLLQRIEDFPGVVILATNLKSNIDDAFSRRFQSMIYFPMPSPDLRLKLWENAFTDKFELSEKIDLRKIANEYELAGGAIINVVRYCALMALNRNSNLITSEDLINGIRKEFRKDGRTS
ncbi:ATP-binding protein [Sporocytophaga myxococcoides]|nr:ATP-binding protein [Sporocytophaga myxococcoides]